MPNPSPKPPKKLTFNDLREHIEKRGYDYDLFEKHMLLGIPPAITRHALIKKRNYVSMPHLNTVKHWADVWLAGRE